MLATGNLAPLALHGSRLNIVGISSYHGAAQHQWKDQGAVCAHWSSGAATAPGPKNAPWPDALWEDEKVLPIPACRASDKLSTRSVEIENE